MAQNRRKAEGEMTFSWIITKLLLFCLLVGLFLGITFLKRSNLKMGDEERILDQKLASARQKTANLEALLARCKSPHELESRMARLHLGMTRPTEAQIRWFREPGASDDGVIMPRMLAQAEIIRSNGRTP